MGGFINEHLPITKNHTNSHLQPTKFCAIRPLKPDNNLFLINSEIHFGINFEFF